MRHRATAKQVDNVCDGENNYNETVITIIITIITLDKGNEK